MNEKVKELLEENKRKFMTDYGLYDIEYAPDEITEDMDIDEIYTMYPNESENGFYRIVPWDITDEEYEILKKELPTTCKKKIQQSQTATALPTIFYLIGILTIIAGIIAGIAIGSAGRHNELAPMGWGIFIASLISALQFIGFGKVISLLDDIKRK